MLRPFKNLRGCTLAASDGEIGKVREFYFDDKEWVVRCLVVETGSWLTGERVLISPRALGGVDAQSGSITVNLNRDEIRHSPPLDSEKPVSRQREAELQHRFRWHPYWTAPGVVPGTAMMPPAVAPTTAFAPAPGLLDSHGPEGAADGDEQKGQKEQYDCHLRSSAELMSGYGIYSQDGETGRIGDFILDDADWSVRYLVVYTGAWFFGKDMLLPPKWVERISYDRSEVFVNLPRSVIKGAPEYDATEPLDRAYEERLHDHYGRKGYWEAVGAEKSAAH